MSEQGNGFEAWLQYANRPDLQEKPRSQVHATYMLCSKHFTRDCFTSDACKRLTRGAVRSVKVQEPKLRSLEDQDFFEEVKQQDTLKVYPLLEHDYCRPSVAARAGDSSPEDDDFHAGATPPSAAATPPATAASPETPLMIVASPATPTTATHFGTPPNIKASQCSR
ncbi:hypothetical protein MTO96_022781 [Rhipicephalus appendiculatus]